MGNGKCEIMGKRIMGNGKCEIRGKMLNVHCAMVNARLGVKG
jgi:hypothetical protein